MVGRRRFMQRATFSSSWWNICRDPTFPSCLLMMSPYFFLHFPSVSSWSLSLTSCLISVDCSTLMCCTCFSLALLLCQILLLLLMCVNSLSLFLDLLLPAVSGTFVCLTDCTWTDLLLIKHFELSLCPSVLCESASSLSRVISQPKSLVWPFNCMFVHHSGVKTTQSDHNSLTFWFICFGKFLLNCLWTLLLLLEGFYISDRCLQCVCGKQFELLAWFVLYK